jgi:ABC-type lipoprotein release transport system permease subunit
VTSLATSADGSVDADATDRLALDAVGLTARDQARAAAAQWFAVGGAAGVIGIALATALSPLSPTGLARLAEPDRGLSVDIPVLGLGLAVCVGACVGAGVLLTLRRLHGRTATVRRRRLRLGPSTVANAGLRVAFERGGPANRVPVWSTVAGVSIAVAATVAAFTVGATLDRQLDDPHRYGVRWDIALTDYETRAPADDGAAFLEHDPRVTAVATGSLASAEVGGREVTVLGLDPVGGELRPPLVSGTYPDTSDAVALGGRTLDRMGVEIGDTVAIGLDSAPSTFRVVGEVVMPAQGAGGRLDEGALFSVAGLERAASEEVSGLELFASLAPGADAKRVIADVEAEVGDIVSIPPPTPDDIVDLGRTRSMPATFAAATAAIAFAAFAHTMIVSTRRRRRDLAMLRALGFTGRQLRTAVAVQATAMAGIALVVGLLGGIVFGRAAWTALAETIGSPLGARVPLGIVGVIVPAVALATALVVSSWPGRDAARSRPATALRTD